MKKKLALWLSNLLKKFGYIKLSLDDIDLIDSALEDYCTAVLQDEGHSKNDSILEYRGDTSWLIAARFTSKKVNSMRERALFTD